LGHILQARRNPIAPLETNLIQKDKGRSRSALPMHILLYTVSGCGACTEAKNYLTSHGILFEERDILSDPEFKRILNDELDSCTTPTLVTGDKIIIGFDKAEYQFLIARPVID
jgi:glutaredoxin